MTPQGVIISFHIMRLLAPALGAYAKSLAETYGQEKLSFVYAQPTAELVEGIAKPVIENSVSFEFGQWPKSLRDIATQLGGLAATKQK